MKYEVMWYKLEIPNSCGFMLIEKVFFEESRLEIGTVLFKLLSYISFIISLSYTSGVVSVVFVFFSSFILMYILNQNV